MHLQGPTSASGIQKGQTVSNFRPYVMTPGSKHLRMLRPSGNRMRNDTAGRIALQAAQSLAVRRRPLKWIKVPRIPSGVLQADLRSSSSPCTASGRSSCERPIWTTLTRLGPSVGGRTRLKHDGVTVSFQAKTEREESRFGGCHQSLGRCMRGWSGTKGQCRLAVRRELPSWSHQPRPVSAKAPHSGRELSRGRTRLMNLKLCL